MTSIPRPPLRRQLSRASCSFAAAALVLFLLPRAATAASLRDFDFEAYLLADVADQCAGVAQPAGIDTLEFADLDGDGQEEAILVAWDCMTGTAGPNIHSVFKAGRDGKPRELPIDEPRGRLELAGNRNYSLHARGRELVREYTDSSGREHPRTEFLRWDGTAFRVVRVEKAPVYRTSFGCARAETDAEITICGDEKLAALDLQLAKAFAAARAKATPEKRAALVAAQRAWLQERDRKCTYKWIQECVGDAYRKRLDELGAAER